MQAELLTRRPPPPTLLVMIFTSLALAVSLEFALVADRGLEAVVHASASATGDQPPPEPEHHGVSTITKDQKMRSSIVSLRPQPPC